MNGSTNQPGRSGTCRDLRQQFQAYLDGDLERERSLELFLHVRDCPECHAELETLKGLFARLDALSAVPVPEDFDARILANVPYAAYREMEPLRRERVPVYLEEAFLPALVRSPFARAGGVIVAGGLAAGLLSGALPDLAGVVAVAGLIPEALVRAQRLARRLHPAAERTGGA